MVGVTLDTSERALVEAALADDEEAAGGLYDRLAPEVPRYLAGLGLGLGHAEVEDVVQESFFRLFRNLERFDRERPLRPYLLGIARRVALETRRGRREHGPLGDTLPTRDTPAPERVERAERRALVHQALAALDPEQRDALAQRHGNRLTMRELALSLSCSIPTARSRLRAAARRFARELRARGLLAPEGAPS